MKLYDVFVYSNLDGYDFEILPKGNMFELSMNPYNGHVFLHFSNRAASIEIAYDILTEVMSACRVIERSGSSDPLGDYVRLSESGELSNFLSEHAKSNLVSAFTVKPGGGRNVERSIA